MRKPLKWYVVGKTVVVNDKMQTGYSYMLEAPAGKQFSPLFKPELTPAQILKLGAFEGKYLNDCTNEFPIEWYIHAKTSKIADPTINLMKIKSRLSLQEWQKRKWIIQPDVRGWFQWYCRYWIGRRIPEVDNIQIKRWRAFIRHKAQVVKSYAVLKKIKSTPKEKLIVYNHRPRQRQALLQWAWNPLVKK